MPTDAELTKTQKNRAFQWVMHYKFEPSDFGWSNVILEEGYGGEFTASSLVHLATRYYFTFGRYSLVCSPGRNIKVEREEHHDNWDRKFSRLDAWLQDVRKEVDAPDMWAIALQHKNLAELPTSPDADENLPFTKMEQDHIAKHLQEIKRFMISTQNLNAEKLRAIEGSIDYLTDASVRGMGRKDWRMILIGFVYTLVIAAVVTPQGAKDLFKMIADTFMPMFQSLWQLEG